MVDAILEEGGKLCAEVFFPLNQSGDDEGCTRHDDGSVTTPTGFKDAFRQLAEGGWVGLGSPEEFGGQGLPHVVLDRVRGVSHLLQPRLRDVSGADAGRDRGDHRGGSDEQKALYLPKMIAGTWTGTMNLTEPHCGTDLGLIKTRAEPQGRRQLLGHRHQDLHLGRRA